MNFYFILTQLFIDQYQGFKIGVNQFNAVQDIQGRWVCSVNSVTEFPELFVGNSFQVVALDEMDFHRFDDDGQLVDDFNGDGIVTEEELTIWQKIVNWFK